LSDAGAGLSTLAMWLLLVTGRLEIWHIYLATTLNSTCSSFQRLAYYASTTLLVPKKHFGRSSGMIQLGRAAAQVAAPVLAAWLVLMVDIQGVILIDVATFIFALFTLQIVRVPKPETSAAGQESRGSFLSEATFGWTYVKARPGLLGLLLFFAATNLGLDMVLVLITPLVLSFTGTSTLGTILSVSGIGMLCGGVVMSIWGGPKRRISGVYSFVLLGTIATLLGGLQSSAPLIAVAFFMLSFCEQIVSGCAQAIWQSKVEPDLQGRVFTVRRMIAYPTTCLAYLTAGPLADNILEPLLANEGPLAGSIGQIIGTGPGRGIGLLYIVVGIFTVLVTIVAYSYPRLRLVEDELPDAVTD
jgi:DHA3 family macrolide efflux protein-like MFS transporter